MKIQRSTFVSVFILIFLSLNERSFSQYQAYVDTLTRVFNTTSAKAGTLPGEVNVNSLGGATYRIPVFVSPGTAGVQPVISIVYNSLSDEGLLGKGWDIDGLSEIKRVSQNFYNDGKVLGVSLTSNDRFALDSNRLILTSGTYGADNSEYATETETFCKVIAHGTSGTGPSWFEITRKDGWKLEYGNTSDSKIEALGSSTVYMWRINKISDQSGNTIKYYYTESGGESYISHIDYTTNDAAGLSTAYNSILFDYTTRTDPNVKYSGGSKIPVTALLTQIRMQTEGSSLVRKYQFKYFTGSFGKTYLNEIFEYGSDNTNKNSTLIVWGGATNGFSVAETYFFQSKNYNYYYGDFNGDGRSDFVVTEKKADYTSIDKWMLYLSSADGNTCSLKNSGYLSSSFKGFFVADVNADGKDELLYKQAATVTYKCNPHPCTISLSSTTSTSSTNGTLAIVPPPPADTCWDYCSINQVDFYNYTYNETTGLARGSTLYDISFSNVDLSIIPVPGDFDGNGNTDYLFMTSSNSFYATYVNGVQKPGVSFTNASDVRLVDFDGDNRKEIQVITGNNCQIFQFNPLTLAFSSIYSSTSFPTSSDRIFNGDFNGDRKTDLLSWRSGTGWSLKLSTGSSYIDAANKPSLTNTDPSASLTDNNYYVADFNGDHMDDILELYKSGSQNKVNAWYSRGNGLFQCEIYDISSYTLNQGFFTPLDLNGDGKKDLFYCNASVSGNYAKLLSFHKNEIRDFVILIANGLDFKTRISYRRLNDSPLSDYYLKSSDAIFPVCDYKGPYYCVNRIVTDNGIGELSAEYFFWSGAKVHRQGKGFLGFTGKVKADIVRTVQSFEQYELNNLYFFMALKKTFRSKSELLSPNPADTIMIQSGINSVIDFGNKRIFPYVSQIRNSDKKLLTTLITYLNYDNYGNLTKSKTVFRNDESGMGAEAAKFRINKYAHYGGWGTIPNRLISTKDSSVYTNESSYYRSKSFGYDASGRLNVEYTDPGLSRCVTTTHTLNSCGLDTKITVSATGLTSRSTSYEYDSKFRYETKVTDPSGAYITNTYFPGTGNVNTSTSIDGLKTTYTYDGFGRACQTTTPQGNVITHSFGWDNTHTGGPYSLYYETTDAANQPFVTVYNDLLGRELMRRSENPNGVYSVEKAYNSQGQLCFQTVPHMIVDELITSYTYAYDSYGRLTKDMIYRGSFNSYSYNGKETVIKRNDGQEIKKTKTNSLGDIISSTEEGFNVRTSYFSNGKPKQMNADGTIVSYHYDDYGNNDQITNPNSGTTVYTYNAFGELVTQKDAGNRTITFTYDVLGRLGTKSGPDGTVTYSYVASGNGRGQVQKIAGPGGVSINYGYDTYGRTTQLTKEISGDQSFGTKFGYDSWNNNTSVTYPSGISITNVFMNGYMTEIKKSDNTSIWKLDSLNGQGQALHYTLNGNSAFMQRFSYDKYHNLLKKIMNQTSIQAYSFDTVKGNLHSRKYSPGGAAYKTETFSYDTGSRLTGSTVTGQTGVSLNYNQGNISNKTNVGIFNYNAVKVNRLDNLTTSSSSVPSLSQSLVYNADNLTTQITQGSSTLGILYSPDGQRIRTIEVENGTVRETKYFSTNYEKEVNASTSRELNYIYCPYGLVAMIIKQGTVQTTYYVETDHQGSIIGLLNPNGTYAEKYSYDAWGRRRNPADWTFTNVALPVITDRGYTGHEHLDRFGLINMNGRMYDPYLGRFMSADPVIQSTTNSQSFNGYSYCLNNPLKFTDPTGYSIYNSPWIDPSHQYVQEMFNELFGLLAEDLPKSLAEQFSIFTYFKVESGGSYLPQSKESGKIKLEEGLDIQYILSTHQKSEYYGWFDIRIGVYGGKYSNYNWIQSYSYNGNSFKIDGMNNGFYYTESQKQDKVFYHEFTNADMFFQDAPNGNDFAAYLTLCGKKGNQWSAIATFSWGYSTLNGNNYYYFYQLRNNPPSHLINISDVLNKFNY